MNWVDIIIIVILTHFTYKGLKLGLVSSIFKIIGFLISIFFVKRYYRVIYEFIIGNELFYGVIENISKIILNILFYSKIEENPDYVLKLISQGLVRFIISILSIAFIFFISNMLIKVVLSIFTFLYRIPIIKIVNKIGGFIFGLIEGIIIVYFLSIIFQQLVVFFPGSRLENGIYNSLIFTYLQNFDIFGIILDIGFDNKSYI